MLRQINPAGVAHRRASQRDLSREHPGAVGGRVDAAGLVFGALGIIVAIVMPLFGENEDLEERYNTIVIGSLCLSVFSLTALIFALRNLLRAKDFHTKAEFECDELRAELFARLGESAALRTHARRVADAFDSLSQKLQKFDALQAEFLKLALASESADASIKKKRERSWNLLTDTYKELLINFCDAARVTLGGKVAEFSPQTNVPENLVCSANLKQLIERAGASDPDYLVLARSESSQLRSDADPQAPVAEHRVYWGILQEIEACAKSGRVPKCWRIIPDIKLELENIENDNSRRGPGELQFRQPSEGASKHYKSCIVMAIMVEEPIWIGVNAGIDRRVLGFICADCTHESFFDEEYDLPVIREISNFASLLMRRYFDAAVVRRLQE